MVRKSIYHEYLEFNSIKKYLESAIGKKKATISKNLTFQEKIKSISLGAYLRGIKIYLEEYSENFKAPSDIIDFWKKNRGNDEKIDVLFKEVENYPIWLKKQGFDDSTCVTYQTHVRGFLTNNHIKLTFKNYKPKTKKREQQNKLGLGFNDMVKFAEKVKQFLHDPDVQFLCEFMHRTGLAWNEIANMTFEDLRLKDLPNMTEDYAKISNERKKSSITFKNFISPALNEYALAWLRINSDKKNTDLLFGNNVATSYQNLKKKFNKAYIKCCNAYFPTWLNMKTKKGNIKKLFSLHSFRSIFKTACDNCGVIDWKRDCMIAHKNQNMPNYDLVNHEELLDDYITVEKFLFGTNTNDNNTIEQVFDILKELVQNNGKRKAIFRKYNEDPSIDMTTEIKGTLFLEQFALDLEKRIEKKVMSNVMNEVKENLKNFSLKDLLISLQ